MKYKIEVERGSYSQQEVNMNTVQKDDKTYTVKECKNHWNVSATIGKLSISYQVPKDICKTIEELKQYIKSENMF